MSGILNSGKINTLLTRLSAVWAAKLDVLHDDRLTDARAGYLDLINTNLDAKISSVGGAVYNSVKYTSDDTHVWPDDFAGVVYVSGAAGGGGGGFNITSSDGGYGGTGGESCVRVPVFIQKSDATSHVVTIGSGGTGRSTAGTGSGTAGTSTSLGGLVTLAGGAGGGSTPGSPPDDGAIGAETIERFWTGGAGGQGETDGTSGGEGGDGMTTNYRATSLDNTGNGGHITSLAGGGGGGSWGDGGDTAASPTSNGGGGGRGGYESSPDIAGQNGADGFLLLEWWE